MASLAGYRPCFGEALGLKWRENSRRSPSRRSRNGMAWPVGACWRWRGGVLHAIEILAKMSYICSGDNRHKCAIAKSIRHGWRARWRRREAAVALAYCGNILGIK